RPQVESSHSAHRILPAPPTGVALFESKGRHIPARAGPSRAPRPGHPYHRAPPAPSSSPPRLQPPRNPGRYHFPSPPFDGPIRLCYTILLNTTPGRSPLTFF